MIIAAAQIACVVGDIDANVRKVREFLERAKSVGAEWVVFPEMSDTGYVMSVIREKATTLDRGAVPQLRALTREFNIGVVCGVAEREGDSIFNSQVVVAASGEIIGKYRKTHLFAPAGEHRCFQPGASIATAKLGNFQTGLSICYDLRFPELYRALTCEGNADLLLVSSAWPIARLAHMQVLARARAIENQSYLVLSNRVGIDKKATFCGNSAIIDPLGHVVAEAGGKDEQLIHARIEASAIAAAREAIPVLQHRRPEVYAASVSSSSNDS